MRAFNRNGELSEAAWQQRVVNYAQFTGWRVYHTHRSDRSQPGFPDLVLIRPPELIFAELKTDSGRTSRPQDEWLRDLRDVGEAVFRFANAASDFIDDPLPDVRAYVWRPQDWPTVQQRLNRGRGPMPLTDPLTTRRPT